jgi:glycosyltransferase involved in cell wall biosynthesis
MPSVDVCLITSSPLASNPRAVKEADALVGDGYSVHIVAREPCAVVRPLEETLVSRSRWSVSYVKLGNRLGRKGRTAINRINRGLFSTVGGSPIGLAVRAHHSLSLPLFREARRFEAKLYVGHNLAALPAAVMAAEHAGAYIGFDAEDFHSGELAPADGTCQELRLRRIIEKHYLPRCHYITAASPGIAEAYRSAYGVHSIVVLNAMQRCAVSRQGRAGCTEEPRGKDFSLYWFSQTISLDRGLETAIEAVSLMAARAHIYIRGTATKNVKQTLQVLASRLGVGDRVHFLAPAPPDNMVTLAACYDVGLSLEQSAPVNRAICLTNKVFTYLSAGIPQLMTTTPAQAEFGFKLGAAAILVPENDPGEWAVRLDKLLLCPERVCEARKHARLLGAEKYSWELERNRFLGEVKRVLGSGRNRKCNRF